MKTFPEIKRIFFAVVFFAVGAVMASGSGFFGSNLKPDNIYTNGLALPASVKRVLVLPLAHETLPMDLASGCEILDPVLQSELIKTKKFELVTITPAELRNLTGQASWTGTEELPANFFSSLQRVYGCDAVLFCQLTTFHAYAPLSAGWRMKLVEASTQNMIWAADIVYDASDSVVAKDAQQFQKQQQGEGPQKAPKKIMETLTSWIYHEPPPVTEEQWTILNSPRYFGQYTLVKLLQTLPER
jgi:hypothetical protein